MIYNTTFENFGAASKAVLEYLYQKLGFRLWMVTRKDGNDWIVLFSEDHGYNVQAGEVFCWADSFCSKMVQGMGPRIAPVSDNVPAYRDAQIGQKVPIQAYIGVPMYRDDGTLFGTLCAIDPETKPEDLLREQAMIELMASLLATILDAELKSVEQKRRAERASVDAMLDPLTGLLNRRGWTELTCKEEERMRRYGSAAGVIYLDLDNLKKVNDHSGHKAGDRLICKTAELLKKTVRESDLVARIGGDEFVVLAVECDPRTCFSLIERIQATFSDAGIAASIGFGLKNATNTIDQAVALADEDMYQQKQARKGESAPSENPRQMMI